MRLSLTWVSALGLGFVSLAACGGSNAVNFFEANGGSAGAATSAAGAPSVSGNQSVAGGASAAGATSSAGGNAAGASDAGGASNAGGASPFGIAGAPNAGASDVPCSPVKDVTDKMTGEFETPGPVCLRVTDDIIGWGCSNFEGRTVKVNGVEVSCAEVPLPDKLHGAYYFDVSAGDKPYASFYWWSL